MPIKMGSTVQSVVITDFVYIGGGEADSDLDMCTVMKLDLQQDEWTKLPQYSARNFALTSLTNKLVLVGGYDPEKQKQTNQIALFESGRWTTPYPPMNIARSFSTAVCFNNYIIVAGGLDDQGKTSSVELLDVESRSWYTADPLLTALSSMKSSLIGNTFYLMGGYDRHHNSNTCVLMADLNELITKTLSQQDTKTLWQVLRATMVKKNSAPLNFEGSLVAVAGVTYGNTSSSIYLHPPDRLSWVRVGDLPTIRYNCTCSVLPNGEVIVAGGWNEGYVSTVDFLSISKNEITEQKSTDIPEAREGCVDVDKESHE